MVNGFDDFSCEAQCDETIDLAWLDRMHYSKQIARLVDHTDDNPLLRELGSICSDVLGVDQIVANGDKTSTRFRSGKSLARESATVEQTASDPSLGGDNPLVELRYNLFGKMLGHYASNSDAKFISPEDFDKCFKGE